MLCLALFVVAVNFVAETIDVAVLLIGTDQSILGTDHAPMSTYGSVCRLLEDRSRGTELRFELLAKFGVGKSKLGVPGRIYPEIKSRWLILFLLSRWRNSIFLTCQLILMNTRSVLEIEFYRCKP